MNTGQLIRSELEQLIVQHPFYAAALERVRAIVHDAFIGLEPRILFLLGPSRTGKSEVDKSVSREHPTVRENGQLIAPVLYVSIRAGTSPKDLPTCIIDALGQPVARSGLRQGALFKVMLMLLVLCKVRVILFDEVNHLVDIGHRIAPRLAGDWFKDLLDVARVSLVLTGVPMTARLLEANEQLRNRSERPVFLMPYRWDRKDERLAFAGCVEAFMGIFRDAGCSVGMYPDELVRQMYRISAGHPGLLANYMRQLASQISAPCLLDEALFSAAAARVNLPGGTAATPFMGSVPDDSTLMLVLADELAINHMVLPVDSAEAELANLKRRRSS